LGGDVELEHEPGGASLEGRLPDTQVIIWAQYNDAGTGTFREQPTQPPETLAPGKGEVGNHEIWLHAGRALEERGLVGNGQDRLKLAMKQVANALTQDLMPVGQQHALDILRVHNTRP
jgi:hypothetical protein